MIKIFVSHSSQDQKVASLLAELIRSALHLPKSDIRCTSVDGYRLPGGANTDEQLRREVLEVPVLVGLVSHHSFESAYVLFELGARWGKNAFLVPVLAPGVSTSVLRGPLSGFNALSCSSASQLHQLVHDVAGQLEMNLRPAVEYQEAIDAIIALNASMAGKAGGADSQSVDTVETGMPLVQTSKQYVDSEAILKRHCESQWGTDFKMRVHCEQQQRSAVEQLINQTHIGVPADIFQKIRDDAARQWPTDFKMRLHTENKQLEAYRSLHRDR